jgi:hypothetical protein
VDLGQLGGRVGFDGFLVVRFRGTRGTLRIVWGTRAGWQWAVRERERERERERGREGGGKWWRYSAVLVRCYTSC